MTVSDTLSSMTRTQLQIDISPQLRQDIKVIAVQNGMSIRELVLTAVADKYPELKPKIVVAKPVKR